MRCEAVTHKLEIRNRRLSVCSFHTASAGRRRSGVKLLTDWLLRLTLCGHSSLCMRGIAGGKVGHQAGMSELFRTNSSSQAVTAFKLLVPSMRCCDSSALALRNVLLSSDVCSHVVQHNCDSSRPRFVRRHTYVSASDRGDWLFESSVLSIRGEATENESLRRISNDCNRIICRRIGSGRSPPVPQGLMAGLNQMA